MKRKRLANVTVFEILYAILLVAMLIAAWFGDVDPVVRNTFLVLAVVLYTGQNLGDKLSRCAAALERLADNNERATREQGMRAMRETWGKQ
jgi:hypothetical protein